ncbi:hypothetical protein PVAP13_3NG222113 [Panicum virgatum]|uniref:Uncharacterized protein n=1 Tax=Panicum virgatum TaxID=38727 RepID=A0A8T0U765_PANVG|nr:hypothetical protein PVAP13_3NG222113 [Panicum virgatum]
MLVQRRSSKEEREVAELHAVSESNSNTSEYIHQFFLFLIGLVSVTPTLLGKKQTHSRAPADTAPSSN